MKKDNLLMSIGIVLLAIYQMLYGAIIFALKGVEGVLIGASFILLICSFFLFLRWIRRRE